MIVVMILKIAVMYLGTRGTISYINMLIGRTEKVNTLLRGDVVAFWFTVMPAVAFYGWMGVLTTIALAYVADKLKNL